MDSRTIAEQSLDFDESSSENRKNEFVVTELVLDELLLQLPAKKVDELRSYSRRLRCYIEKYRHNLELVDVEELFIRIEKNDSNGENLFRLKCNNFDSFKIAIHPNSISGEDLKKYINNIRAENVEIECEEVFDFLNRKWLARQQKLTLSFLKSEEKFLRFLETTKCSDWRFCDFNFFLDLDMALTKINEVSCLSSFTSSSYTEASLKLISEKSVGIQCVNLISSSMNLISMESVIEFIKNTKFQRKADNGNPDVSFGVVNLAREGIKKEIAKLNSVRGFKVFTTNILRPSYIEFIIETPGELNVSFKFKHILK